MASAARDRLARVLRGDVTAAFSVALTARPDDLNLEVDGFGTVKFPVTPAKARKLIGLGQPARFGRGEETVTDAAVRDTWEIPGHLVRASWNPAMFTVILETVKEELGLPNGAELTAEPHSLLVYEPDQFFLAHQDSEKDDSMVGTLVVTLPSNYSGGDLVVSHHEERKTYRGSKTALSLVAFYADCQHEVRKVTSGYRITLTCNLLLHGDTSRPEGEDGKVAELVGLLREHFDTPAPRYSYGPADEPPNRLVYLLDHEYTPRALGWTRLKGADATRVSLLRTAAERGGYEAVLALADIKTTHSALPAHQGRYRRQSWYDDDDEEEYGRSDAAGRKFDIQELVDSEVTLTHWTGLDGRRLEKTSLPVSDGEICAATENGDLVPYSAEYEGYMGNWGNTLDRWYHRAAVVVWPASQAFANRAETSPAWALDELTALAAAGDAAPARAAAATLEPFWERAVRGLTGLSALTSRSAAAEQETATLIGKALRTAGAVADAETAELLLRPLRVENLTESHAGALAAVAGDYGQEWTAELLHGWFGGDRSPWQYDGGADRPRWVSERLAGLCAGLSGSGDGGGMAARLLLDLAWKWLVREIEAALTVPTPGFLTRRLGELGAPAAAVLTSAAVLGAADSVEAVYGYIRECGDAITVLELSALRAVGQASRDSEPGDAGFAELAADCAERLRARLGRPPRAPGDWAIELPDDGCGCQLCGTLRTFLANPGRRSLEWPLAQDGRRHVHARIDNAELAVTHLTRRQGRPYTLVLTKTDELFSREREARETAEADLEWLAARWNTPG